MVRNNTTPEFYVIDRGELLFGSKYGWGETEEPKIWGVRGLYEKCPVCGTGMGLRPWLPPQNLSLHGRMFPDFMLGHGVDLMLSRPALELYDKKGWTGIVHRDPPAHIVRVRRKKPESLQVELPEYSNVWNTRLGANLDDEASGAVRRAVRCAYCRQSTDAIERVVLQAGSWNGADIFAARGLGGTTLVSRRFVEGMAEAGLTGVVVLAPEDYSFSFAV
ncbi:MAG: hypothetical protein KGJ62_02050 [Armatimonadetes bacterium]|nr:hypothetical protein [Armatimonadota bacterium]MDE2206086.1 hypothetical protein [Armatimonadota bacterium]